MPAARHGLAGRLQVQARGDFFRQIEEQLQPIFRLFALVNIRVQAIPADYSSFCAVHRKGANLEPAVYAIATTDAVLRVISSWMPGFDGLSPRGQHARKVIGMNNV